MDEKRMTEAARIMHEEERGSPGWIDAAAGLLDAFDTPEFTCCSSCKTPGAPITSVADLRRDNTLRVVADRGPAALLVLLLPGGGRTALCHTCVEKIGFPWPDENEP